MAKFTAMPIVCLLRLILLILVAAALSIGLRTNASAAESDCLEDGGLAQCSKPVLTDWKYGACINSLFMSTILASGRCMEQNPDSSLSEGALLGYAACMPIEESSACSSSASLSGWASSGSTTLGVCGTFSVQYQNGEQTRSWSYINYSVTYPTENGPCEEGSYTATIATRTRSWICPTGSNTKTRPNGEQVCARNFASVAPPCEDCNGIVNQNGATKIGNPIQISTREKIQVEKDYQGPILRFIRTYRGFGGFHPIGTQPYIPTALGKKWFHTYDRRVYGYPGNSYVMASALRPNGDIRYFKTNGREKIFLGASALLEPQYSGSTLTGWRLTTTEHEIEEYDADGRLLTINTQGRMQTMTYSDGSTPSSIAPFPGLLIQVTDHAGRSLQFRYDTKGRLIKMIDPDANEYLYAYDEASAERKTGEIPANDLTSVTYPQTGTSPSKRIYHYNEPTWYDPPALISGTNVYPRALTGITSESGARIGYYEYSDDVNGRAYHTLGWNYQNRYSISQSGVVGNNVNTQLGPWKKFVAAPTGSTGTSVLAGATRITSVTTACGNGNPSCSAVNAYWYDADGRMTVANYTQGARSTFVYDTSRGLETQRTEGKNHSNQTTPVTRTISTQWHSTFNLPTLITETGKTTSFTYDSNGNVLTKTITDTTSSKSRTWTYTYTSLGQIATIDGPRTDVSDVTTFGYDSSGNLITITNALSQVTSITSHDAHGRPLTIVDPNGLTTTLTYNARGWIASRTVGSEVTTYEYDLDGHLIKTTHPDASYTETVTDPNGRLTEILDAAGNKIVYTYDNPGNLLKEEVFDSGSSLVQTRSQTFNELLRKTQDIGGTNPSTQIVSYVYDNAGNLLTKTEPTSRVTTYAYDILNRLTQITAPGSNVTKFAYNTRDQLTSVTDPRNNVTTYTINALDEVTQQFSPDTGTTVMTYDAAGNLLTSRDAKLQTTTYTYDALNRVLDATFHDGSKVEYGYDAGTYGIGRLTSITEKNPGGTVVTSTTYTYSIHGRLLTDTRVIGGISYVTTYGYDSAGRLNSVTYPSGRQLLYAFDSVGRISGINTVPPGGGSPQVVISGVTYHPFGGVKEFTYGNSQTYSRTYDLDGRIAGFTLPGQSHTVSFDAASRITGASFIPNPAQSITYGYDNLDRLTSAVTPLTTFGYAYDANANRTSKTVGGSTQTYSYPSTSNKLSSISGGGSWTYTHDANGSITSDGVNTFTYDTRGRLVGAATALGAVTYGLNALGQRYAKTVGGVTTVFHYDQGGTLIGESDAAGNTLTEYVYLGDVPVALFR